MLELGKIYRSPVSYYPLVFVIRENQFFLEYYFNIEIKALKDRMLILKKLENVPVYLKNNSGVTEKITTRKVLYEALLLEQKRTIWLTDPYGFIEVRS